MHQASSIYKLSGAPSHVITASHFSSLSLKLSKGQPGSDPLRADTAEAQRDPARDLFLWAVIQNNKELAEIAWEQVTRHKQTKFEDSPFVLCEDQLVSVFVQCRDCMSSALAASKILKTMAEEGNDTDESAEMQQLASHYETRAIGITPQT